MRRWFIEGLILTNVLTVLGLLVLVAAVIHPRIDGQIAFSVVAIFSFIANLQICRALLQSYEWHRSQKP